MAKAKAAKPAPKRVRARQISDDEELVRVWVTRVRSGATAASRVHGISRAAVYDVCARVDGDRALLARAERHLATLRAELDATEKHVHAAELEARLALVTQLRMRAGDMSPAQIVEALGVLAPEGDANGGGGGNLIIQVPAVMAVERKDGAA